MSHKSSKAQQGAVVPISVKFDGGLNLADSPAQIGDNEMVRALNIIYNSQTGIPETRHGTTCVTAAALASPILKIFNYEKSAISKYLVCASGGKLYYLATAAWVEIGSLHDSTTVPSFMTFNTKLLIADGGVNIKTWDGTTFSALADGLTPNAIAEIGGRIVINSETEPDLVTFSGVEDDTKWNTATEGAVGIRVGFGDNMIVNAFAVFGNDLIVSKRGESEKRFYRINIADGTPANWVVSRLTANNCSQNAHTIVSAFNNVFFVDNNGFKSIKGVTEYGDMQVDMVGAKINTQFARNACYEVSYLPLFTAIWYMVADRVYAYHRIYDDSGNLKHAFTEMQYGQGKITSVMQTGSTVYLAGENGYLYKTSETAATDETSPGVFVAFPTLGVSKRFSFFGSGILRKTSLEVKSLDISGSYTANIRANTAEREGILLKNFPILSQGEELYSATGDLYDATATLGTMAGSAWIETTTNRVRGSSIQFQFDSTAGRFGVEGLQAEVALVGG